MIARSWYLACALAVALAAAGCGTDGAKDGSDLVPGGSGGQDGTAGSGGTDAEGGNGGADGEGGIGGVGGADVGAGGEGGSGGEGGAGGTGGTGGVEEYPGVASVRIQADEACTFCRELRRGSTRPFVATLFDSDGFEVLDLDPPAKWSSSDPEVLTVDGGLARGIKRGQAILRVEVAGMYATLPMEVIPPAVVTIEVTPASVVLHQDETMEIVAVPKDAAGEVVTDAELAGQVANPGVARPEPGYLTGTARGTTVLYIYSRWDAGVEIEVPVEVQSDQPYPEGMKFKSFSRGVDNSCGIGLDDKAYCWGWDYWGQLGRNEMSDDGRPTPGLVRVDQIVQGREGPLDPIGLPDLEFTSIVSKHAHSCALEPNGNAWCWGYNVGGELGAGGVSGDLLGSMVPVPVAQELPFSQIATGYGGSCALALGGGKAWCWGSNYSGEVGNGLAYGEPGWEDRYFSPVEVAGGHDFKQIEQGNGVSCALDTDGKTWCWGDNRQRGLATGNAEPRESPTPLEVVGGHSFTDLDLSANHVCALKASGEVFCWGENLSGQTGTKPTFDTPTNESWTIPEPTLVPGGHHFTDVATGAHHSCAVDLQGDAWCWGNNDYGQLGDGSDLPSVTPVKVIGEWKFVSLYAGNTNSCGLTASGSAYCWGSGFKGSSGAGFDMMYTHEPWPVAQPEVVE